MARETLYIVLAVVMFGLIPLVPKMITFRTRVLYALHLNRLAHWHEMNASTLVTVVRCIIAAIGVVLLLLGFGGFQ